MRLNKYLVSCNIGSRRKCDELISSGKVSVNGQIASLGQEISDSDKVYVDNQLVTPQEEKFYFVFNKPKGCITTKSDDRGRKTVIDLFNLAYQKAYGKENNIPNVYPIGRLDYNTQGLLLLTNDGDFANKILHPKQKIPKTYKVLVYPHLTSANVDKLQKGVVIDGVKTLPSVVKILKNEDKKQWVEITITQGRNRQIRKMIESVGATVNELERTRVGKIELNNLKRGEIRQLTNEEINSF